MQAYRTHHCGQLRESNVGETVKLSGWVHRKRDHGGVFFIDLRDHYGITQVVTSYEEISLNHLSQEQYKELTHLNYESVITVSGQVVRRSDDTINKDLPTGAIEVVIEDYTVESVADVLPMNVNTDQPFPENIRLKYRFLDLRRDKLHQNITLRNQVIASIRKRMWDYGFMEFHTPILTANSPEGARDFLVPSRLHPGRFYALPQAPQQFKQFLMISGFDKYFQIAPCFRDEDARADRAPGEFYQLDIEMSFVTQEDIFNIVEELLYNIFKEFSAADINHYPFPRITYRDAMLKYGSDKPDLRNPIQICEVADIFEKSEFTIFKKGVANGKIVRAIPAPGTSGQPRSFFDKMITFAQQELGAGGLAYIIFNEGGEAKGPIAKFLNADQLEILKQRAGLNNGDAVFFACEKEALAISIAAGVREKLGIDLELLDNNAFRFCWIIDFPYYGWDEEDQCIDFFHNPFSMPQGGLSALKNADTVEKQLALNAYQYDIVCNGIELSSGAIRNHRLDILYKAFNIAGYSKESVDKEFTGMVKALSYGAPPHGGIAPGLDRMIMLLAQEPNIREVIPFPLNQNAQDLLTNAPASVYDKHLKELNIMLSSKAIAALEDE